MGEDDLQLVIVDIDGGDKGVDERLNVLFVLNLPASETVQPGYHGGLIYLDQR